MLVGIRGITWPVAPTNEFLEKTGSMLVHGRQHLQYRCIFVVPTCRSRAMLQESWLDCAESFIDFLIELARTTSVITGVLAFWPSSMKARLVLVRTMHSTYALCTL